MANVIIYKLYKILIILVAGIFICAMLGKISVAATDNATAAGDFLNIGVSARAAGLGGAFTSVANDAAAAYWNPSGLVSIESPQLIFSHFAWYQDISYEYLAVAYPANDRLSFSIQASYLNYGTIDGYDAYDNPTGDVNSTYDMATGLSVGYGITENLSVGVTAKYVVLSLDNLKASAVAGDFGVKYNFGNYVLGLAVANVGQDFKFNHEMEKLPTNVRFGVAARPFGPSILGAIELENQFHGSMSVKNGVEYNYDERYFLRAGYTIHPGEDNRTVGQSFSFGAGALLGPTQFDYTFSPKEKIGSESIHRFSIIFRL